MSRYREILYRNYSAHFGSGKSGDAAVQFAQYDQCYRPFLPMPTAMVGDLGCGRGEWLAWMQKNGAQNLWGADYSADDLAVTRQRAPAAELAQGDAISALGAKSPGYFDVLHAKDVLEHLTRDELFDFLAACHRALKPGGHLWLLTYNAQAPLANATRYGDLTHEGGYTPSSLGQGLRAAGYEIVRIHGVHICPATSTGRVRRLTYRALGMFYRVALKARHGGGGNDGSIDGLAIEPDLFTIARRSSS